jgi:hypothetical protein
LTRYVVSAVALSAVICVAAVVHATGMRAGATASREASAPSLAPGTLVAAAAAQPPIEPTVAPALTTDTVASSPVAPAAAEPAQPPPEVPPAAVEGVVAPAAAPAPALVGPALVGEIAGPKPSSGGAATDEPNDPHAALAAKQESQRALDLGKVALSIEAGERSVRLDATDAEAWLILGAAYLQHGGGAQARRSFTSCVQLAKRGPRNECAALLR